MRNKYPGKIAFKLSLWERFMFWVSGLFTPKIKSLDMSKYKKEDQEIINRIYNLAFDREFLRALPPLNIKPSTNELKPNNTKIPGAV
jgi:hypothetical protein